MGYSNCARQDRWARRCAPSAAEWDAERPIWVQDGWDQHAAFVGRLVDDGFIVAGGTVGDGEETLHLVEAADESEIRARLAQDLWDSADLLLTGTSGAWALWLDGRRVIPRHG